MSYFFRRILFIVNVILLLASVTLCIYSVFTFIMTPGAWLFSLLLFGVGITTGLFFLMIYAIRKRTYPLPGIDYK
jgi:hypothetical protein